MIEQLEKEKQRVMDEDLQDFYKQSTYVSIGMVLLTLLIVLSIMSFVIVKSCHNIGGEMQFNWTHNYIECVKGKSDG